MYSRKILIDTPHILEVTDEELDILIDAVIGLILTPSNFAKPQPRQVLKELERARAQTKSEQMTREQREDLKSSSTDTCPLLDWLSACHEPTADPVKPVNRLRAAARPKRVTGSAARGKRSANRSKEETDQGTEPCHE